MQQVRYCNHHATLVLSCLLDCLAHVLQMMTTAMFGLPLTPAALADEKDNTVVVSKCLNGEWLERILRPVCTAMGCSAGLCPTNSCPAPVNGFSVRLHKR